MKIKLFRKGRYALVIKEKGDPKFYSESSLYYAIKKVMLRKGYDVIKKLMQKDGHLVDQYQYYIRERKWKFCLVDGNYMIRQAQEDFNRGLLTLRYLYGKSW